ncbi:MAG: DEAD/DEAH box helicase [Maritimibacter sp.]
MISPLSEALAERGYDQLTPVQEAVIAPELAGSDLLVSAQTGSGKTVGFGLAIAPTLLGDDLAFGHAAAPMALIVAPTRELAFQVKHELTWLYSKTGAMTASCVGGMDVRQERRALERGAHIVVGTPGRLRDHIERGSLDLSEIKAVVLDEADEMLDLGFREDLEFILGAAPDSRRTLLFSATVPPMIAKLAQQFQRDAQRINTVSTGQQHADISYQALRVAAPDSEHAIFNLLRFYHDEGAIIFANTRAEVNHLTTRLANRGFATVSLSGELSQTERSHALQAMRDGRARICVATDVAARGIDLPNLNLVIHADLPKNTESLLHRSGRTGRAGRKGISALIVPPRELKRAERLLKWAKINAEWTIPPSAEDIRGQDEARLLNDPAWDEELTDEQRSFAEKLLASRNPETIAAAYLRLYQQRNAAPEELLPPDTKPEKRQTRDFGPSRWVALSVGRDDRAEARWLLPLLCRAGNLDKTAIGAIRVQEDETLVELSEPSIAGFMAALGEGSVLEDGITVRPVEGAPARRGMRPDDGGKSSPRPGGKKPYKPRGDGDRPYGDKPRGDRPRSDKPRGDKPYRKSKPDEYDGRNAGFSKPAPKPERKADAAPDHGEGKREDKKPRHKAAPERREKPKGDFGGPEKKGGYKGKSDGKPGSKFGGKPRDKGEGRKSEGGKSWDKPKGKPAGKPAADARDLSKRFTPPGKPGGKPAGKPGGKPRKPGGGGRGEGGNAVPRRGKR